MQEHLGNESDLQLRREAGDGIEPILLQMREARVNLLQVINDGGVINDKIIRQVIEGTGVGWRIDRVVGELCEEGEIVYIGNGYQRPSRLGGYAVGAIVALEESSIT